MTMTPTYCREALDALTVDPVLMFFPRACNSRRGHIRLPPVAVALP